MTEALLDTSVWLALAQAEAPPVGSKALLDARPVLSHLAMAEIEAHIALGRLRGDVDKLYELLREARQEPLLAEDPAPAAKLYARLRRDGGKASLIDCLMLTIARRIGCPFVTLDSALRKEEDVQYLRGG